MSSLNAASLVNLTGFSLGLALYGMLAMMVLRHRRGGLGNTGILLLITAALGILWNAGELYAFAQADLGLRTMPPIFAAIAFSALGFLPSVVVHFAGSESDKTNRLTYLAYAISTLAALLHVGEASTAGSVPSDLAFTVLAAGSLVLAAAIFIFKLHQTLERKAIWAAALLVFAASALHLGGEKETTYWYVELFAHQSSLPIALAILYQNYRFAFADLFLKRAISLMMLASVAVAFYIFVAVPGLRYHETHDRDDVLAAGLIIGLWVITALTYPAIYRAASWFVDAVILKRADYSELLRTISTEMDLALSQDVATAAAASHISRTLAADHFESHLTDERTDGVDIVQNTLDSVSVIVPTTEEPHPVLEFRELAGGRRLLSDDVSFLESVAFIVARRIDALRVDHERCEREFREQEFVRLATEAQLTALRSQVNPHFLFNALTTIGYLIRSSPDRAYDTLLRLTQLLRGVLKTTGEFTTLGEEIGIIESYLDIERARFEERLAVTIDIADELRKIEIPSLILQPLVENAIKHAVSENRNGGAVEVTARLSVEALVMSVSDTGRGEIAAVSAKTKGGVGLANIRERLAAYYDDAASLELRDNRYGGTTAEITIPLASTAAKKAA
ncbi:MAG: histidine kinase [Acidobacteriota bacterium]|nr:MAG: histidine kinase [Acidobacteriota bacterium]